ncbi:MAG: hypothetical protein WC859_02905 [Elusimicrobiota bacterium]|jgi:hypothetical protein
MAVIGMMGLWAVVFLKTNTKIGRFYDQSNLERSMDKAMDALVSDLREADPVSIANDNVWPMNPDHILFTQSVYDNTGNSTQARFQYAVSPDTPMVLARSTCNADWSVCNPQTLFTPPNPSDTLQLSFTKDVNLIVVTFSCKAVGMPQPFQRIRHVAIRG